MPRFEKIKTASDRKYAQAQRGYTIKDDIKAGDVLVFSEKMDGYNIGFDANGFIYSRQYVASTPGIRRDPVYAWASHKPISGAARFIDDAAFLTSLTTWPGCNPDHEYCFFGEYMVKNRLIPYKPEVYDTCYLFDVYDVTEQRYLGVEVAAMVVAHIKANVSAEIAACFMAPRLIATDYVFSSYEQLEADIAEHYLRSAYAIDGVAEGVVVATRNEQASANRVKVINQKYKELQRETQTKPRTAALRWLATYLTASRVKKHAMNLQVEGLLDPTSKDYYTTQLALLCRIIKEDIFEEANEIIELSESDILDINNKIEGYTRLILIEVKTYLV